MYLQFFRMCRRTIGKKDQSVAIFDHFDAPTPLTLKSLALKPLVLTLRILIRHRKCVEPNELVVYAG